MAFFDKITKATQDAVRGAKDMTDVVRLNSLISEEKKKMEAVFSQIGKAYYDGHEGDVPEEFAGYFASVKEIKENMDKYNEDIKRIKGTKICEKCGAENLSTAAFCNNCGAPMESVDKSDDTHKKCPNCGASIEPDAVFCTSCGTKL